MLSAILCADFGSICANLKRELGDRIGLSKCQRGDGRAAEGSPPVGVMLGLYRDNGKENGNYYSILGLFWDTGKENGNYCSLLGLYRDTGKENGKYYSILGVLCSCWFRMDSKGRDET